MKKLIERSLRDSIKAKETFINENMDNIIQLAEKIVLTFTSDKKIMHCGNGESAADAQHIAAEFVSRFYFDRPGLSAISLSTDTSILTAIGMTEHLIIMICAVVIAIIIMMILAKSISDFISKHPTLQILALSFLILIGFMLMLESFDFHIPKGYIYFAVAFSLLVEILNMRFRKTHTKPNQKKQLSNTE